MAVINFPDSKYYEYKESFTLKSEETLPSFTLAYETFGDLDSDASNAILIFHALSGSAHVTRHPEEIEEIKGIKGWWENLVGPNKAFDTNKYFIICINVIGSCYGSTGPSSKNPKDFSTYGLKFPILTIQDMVNSQKLLIDSLGIEKLLAVTGGSMGGMQVVQWVLNFPETVKCAIPISTPALSSSQNIAFNEVGRQAIMTDPKWNDGNYYDSNPPDLGLSIARMIGHITYLSEDSMKNKFGRRLLKTNGSIKKFANEFEVERYLNYKGLSFTKRFDANSYLYITKAMDLYNIRADYDLVAMRNEKKEDLEKVKFLILSFHSDWLYPAHQSKDLVNLLKMLSIPVSYCQIESNYGHDAFLLESKFQEPIIREFLKNA